MTLKDYTGVIHFHSSLSFDGHAPMEDIVTAANKNHIDFLMLTDHDHLRAKEQGWEGWQGKTLVIVGEEIAPRFNHYLAFRINEPIICDGGGEEINPQTYIDTVNRQGGIGFIAHPDHEGTKVFHVKHYCWNNWNVSGYTGIGVWDFMTDWQSNLTGHLRGLMCFLFPTYFLKGPKKNTLDRWDQLNQIRKTVGIGELDNHASTKKIAGVSFVAFPFNRALRFICTHILTDGAFTGESQKDINMVYDSLSRGRCYFSLEYFCRAKGFEFLINQNHSDFYMGDRFKLTGNAKLHVSCSEKSHIRIIRNGKNYHQIISDHLSMPIEEDGVYRAEVYLKSKGKIRPWIFSNPIYVN